MSDSQHSGWRVVAIIFIAIAIVGGLQFLPLSKWSNGLLSDFNLLSDITDTPQSDSDDDDVNDDIEIDPLIAEEIDTRQIDTTGVEAGSKPLIAVQPNVVDGQVVIEDYTASGHGLENLRKAIKDGRMARIAVIGDSYIEGDIFTQDLRDMLQKKYGGSGVGYVNMYSEFPGFRRSIKQSGGKGWKEYSAKDKSESKYLTLTQHYYTLDTPTKSTYSGTETFPNASKWNQSKFLFVSPSDATIRLTTSSGTKEYPVKSSAELQCLTVNEPTDLFEVEVSNKSVKGIGVWLTDTNGVNVDCMSSRGFSGLTLANVDANISKKLSESIPYDLIVLEFGMNAMSPKQTNFSGYTKKMESVINHLKATYPNTDILVMGIGDRGKKSGTEVHSMVGVSHLINAQRDMARRTGTLFFDTREAMGGEDAIVKWVKNGWANTDYIHMNHKGGHELAKPFFKAIESNIEK